MKKIRKWINHILYDKDAFHKDNVLRTMVELHSYLLDNLIELDKQIAPRKMRYFWENKKVFLFRLFAKMILTLSVVAGIVFVGWFVGFRYTPPAPTYDRWVTLYVPVDTDTIYLKSRISKVRFIIMYPTDPHKEWEAFKEAMHFKYETVGLSDSAAYKTRRMTKNKEGKMAPSQFWGKYQMGQSARDDCDIGGMSWEEFSTNPEIQEGTFKRWIRILYRDMTPYILKYEGRFIAGHQITASGIISMAHNVGEDATVQFLTSGGATVPMDGDGVNTPKAPATRFLSLGGYNLTSILE
jgi:hypothetical protein